MQEQEQMKAPAYNLEAEMSVLGGMLIDEDAAVKAMDMLTAGDFYLESHRLLFGVLAEMSSEGRKLEIVTLSDELSRRELHHKVGGNAYLATLWDYVSSAANIEYHAQIVAERSQLRQLMRVGAEVNSMVREGKRADEVHAKAEAMVFAAGQRTVVNAPLMPVKDVIWKVYEKLENEEPDVLTGWKDFDRLTGGFVRGDLIVLAARPSMGKTSAALQWAVNIADNEKQPVAVFSLEMSAEALGRRILFCESRVDGSNFNVEDKPALNRMETATSFIAKLPLFIHERAKTVRDMRSHCRRLTMEKGQMGAIVVDYLGKMRGTRGTENRIHELGEITGDLKAMAVELKCPVIVLCQLSRAVEARPDKRPALSDLRDSGEIEQDADTVVMLYRPEYYFGPTKDGKSIAGLAEVMVKKQRNGAVGDVLMHFEAQYTRFSDLARFGGER